MPNHLWVPPGAVQEPRPASLIRQLRQEDIQCPAGTVVGDSCVRCAVEQGTIDGRTDTSTVSNFCMANYALCPSWQAEHERIAAGRKTVFDRRDLAEMKATREARRERIERIKELLASNSPAGRKFRRALGLAEEV